VLRRNGISLRALRDHAKKEEVSEGGGLVVRRPLGPSATCGAAALEALPDRACRWSLGDPAEPASLSAVRPLRAAGPIARLMSRKPFIMRTIMSISGSESTEVLAWRSLIQLSDLPSLTKLVCLNLSLYLAHQSDACWPTAREQMRDTGLSLGLLEKHLRIARFRGYLTRVPNTAAAHGGPAAIYRATFPGSAFARPAGNPEIPPALLPAIQIHHGARCFAA
jgi:hypothetical protein